MVASDGLVRAERIEGLFAHGLAPHVASIIYGVLLAAALGWSTAWPARAIWLAAVCAVAVMGLTLTARYRRRRPPPEEAARWGKLYLIGAGISGLLWGSVALVFPFPALQDPALDVVLLCLVGGLIAGATVIGSTYHPAFHAFAAPAALPLIVVLLIGRERIETAAAAVLALFVVVAGVLSRVADQTFSDSARLRLRLDQQREAAARAQQAVRSRDEFIAVASHELMTPLTGLQIHLRAMEMEIPRLDAAASRVFRDSVPVFTRQVKRLAALVDTVFRVAGAESERVVLTPQQIDVTDVVRSAVADVQANDTLNPTRLTIGLAAHQPLLGRLDPVRVEQIVVNLLSNALKYGGGAPVVVSVARDPRDSATLLLTVADQGPGIPAEDHQRIFEKFHRGSAADQHRGAGLGLFVVRQLVAAMGGAIQVQSSPGAGSTFAVSLPINPR